MHLPGAGVPTQGTFHWGHPLGESNVAYTQFADALFRHRRRRRIKTQQKNPRLRKIQFLEIGDL
jgi:hypothetical protein